MNRTTQHALATTCATLMLIAGGQAAAAPVSADKVQYDAAKKAALDRYNGDLELCTQEKTASARMQCKRDASSEYKKAMADAKAKRDEAKKTAAATAAPAAAAAMKPPAAACKECGKVIAVNTGEKAGKGGPLGVIAGGVAGAVLGHQVGKGTGKDVATIAGAAGGAYAGHKIEEKMTATRYWAVSVRFEGGEERTFEFTQEPGFAVGDAVKASDGSIVRR